MLIFLNYSLSGKRLALCLWMGFSGTLRPQADCTANKIETNYAKSYSGL